MRFFRWLLRCLAIFIGILLLILIIFSIYVYNVSDDIVPPKVADTSAFAINRVHTESTLYTIGDNWIRKNRNVLYEMYVSGNAFDRGVKNGKLSQELIVAQEEAFTAQIKQMIRGNDGTSENFV